MRCRGKQRITKLFMAEQEQRLTLVRELSRSGIATVWEGYDSGLDRKVLVKSIHPQYARDPELRTRFEREARAVARLSHPNVVQIYDLRADADELSIILEFVDGVTLGKLLKEQGRLPVDAAVTVADEILAGLEHAHAAAIIHRDLKPENVLIATRGDVKITDFGLASLRDQPAVTQDGAVVGTPSYMAPEQAEGASLSPATDIFSTGLILFEMLTGQRVHQGGSLAESLQSVLRYQPPKLEDYGEQIPAALRPVLSRMLERSPGKRYATAKEARQALRETHGERLLPPLLIADFLSGESPRRPAAKRTARSRAWSGPLRTLTIAVLVLMGAGLVFHFATLRTESQRAHDFEAAADSTAQNTAPDSTAGGLPSTVITATTPVIQAADSAPVPGLPPVAGTIAKPPPVVFPPVQRFGRLDIFCVPWASVYIGDSLVGATPLPGPLRLPAGQYNLVFLNPEIGHPVVRTAEVPADGTLELRVNLFDYVGRIRIASAKPWADVYVDGQFELRTPSSKIVFKPLGLHVVTLKNPAFPDYTDTLVLREGDPIHEFRIDLTQIK